MDDINMTRSEYLGTIIKDIQLKYARKCRWDAESSETRTLGRLLKMLSLQKFLLDNGYHEEFGAHEIMETVRLGHSSPETIDVTYGEDLLEPLLMERMLATKTDPRDATRYATDHLEMWMLGPGGLRSRIDEDGDWTRPNEETVTSLFSELAGPRKSSN